MRFISALLVAASTAAAQVPVDEHVHNATTAAPLRIHGLQGFLDYESGQAPSATLPVSLVSLHAEAEPASALRSHQTAGRRIDINWELLDALDAAGSGRASLTLLDGRTIELAFVRAEQHGPRRTTWFGQIAGIPASDFILSRVDSTLRLILRDYENRERWEIHFVPESVAAPAGHALRASSSMAEGANFCGTDSTTRPSPPDHESPQGSYGDRSVTDPYFRLDAMFVATNDCLVFLGGESAVWAEVEVLVGDFNLVNSNVGMDFGIRVVGVTASSGYNEAAEGGTDLERLRLANDGFLDGVHGTRDLVRADIVCLLRRSSWGGGSTLGVANRANSENTNPTEGFSVTAVNQGAPERTFTHEIGHNLGACHDVAQGACSNPLLAGINGYRHSCNIGCNLWWRDRMAYNSADRCPDGDFALPIFSDPNIVISGGPLCGSFAMGDTDANIRNMLLTSRTIMTQWRTGSTQVWAHPWNQNGGDGSYYRPFGRFYNAVANVAGGVSEGRVRVLGGVVFQDTAGAGGAVVYRTPCLVQLEGPTSAVVR
ncbi:MAG: M12 family metallo-peptidase [Phycisphaerales bacterium]